MEKGKLIIGGVVVYIDEHRQEHHALVTAIHGDPDGIVYQQVRNEDGSTKCDDQGAIIWKATDLRQWPCINLIFVSPNEACQDQYGRQLERNASVVHQSMSSAQGFCYRFLDEVLDESMRQPTVS